MGKGFSNTTGISRKISNCHTDRAKSLQKSCFSTNDYLLYTSMKTPTITYVVVQTRPTFYAYRVIINRFKL